METLNGIYELRGSFMLHTIPKDASMVEVVIIDVSIPIPLGPSEPVGPVSLVGPI
jgi:hypothetical protein